MSLQAQVRPGLRGARKALLAAPDQKAAYDAKWGLVTYAGTLNCWIPGDYTHLTFCLDLSEYLRRDDLVALPCTVNGVEGRILRQEQRPTVYPGDTMFEIACADFVPDAGYDSWVTLEAEGL